MLIDDGARPFPDAGLIDRVLAGLDEAPAAIPACRSRYDQARRRRVISETMDRSSLWRAQTPQGFHFDAILAAHRAAAGRELTDDCRGCRSRGMAPVVVPGSEDNFKVTTAEDLEPPNG